LSLSGREVGSGSANRPSAARRSHRARRGSSCGWRHLPSGWYLCCLRGLPGQGPRGCPGPHRWL